MTEHREIIDNIVAFLSSSQNAETEGISELADAYAKLCRETNARLRLCSDALRQGLRSDAIQIAETEPNLLDLVAALDFPELPQWREICVLQGLSEPPPLHLEAAASLNEAYATEQPLENMQAHLRLMALGRAPMQDRIIMMRRIAERDASSTFWDDDIRVFERKRMEEIRAELNQAIRAADNVTATRLRDEATAPGWRAEVPKDLLNLLRDAAGRLSAAKTIAELRELLPKLNDAYGAMAYQECKTLLAQWLEIVTSANLKVPTDLQEATSPIVDWVLEQDQRQEQQAAFSQACDGLQQVIDTNQSIPALERAYRATLAFHIDLPEELASRYHQRLAALASAIRHKRRLIYVGIAAAFIIVAGIVVLVAYQSMLANEISQAQKTLTDAVSDVQQGELDKGQTIRKQVVELHPRILRSPLIIKTLSDLDSAVDAERKRRVSFQQDMLAATNAGIEHPDETELNAAAALAKLPLEIAQVDEFKGRIEQLRAQSQQEKDQQFTAIGTAISAEADHKLTPQLLTSNVDDYRKEIDLLKNRVDELRNRTGVSDGLKQAQLASLDAILNRRQQDLGGAKSAREALDHVREFGSTAEQHVAALKQFIATCPDDPRCAGFKIAMDHLSAEQAVETWAGIVSHWSKPSPANLQEAKDRVAQIKDYLDHNADSPVATPVNAYLDYLNKGIETVSADGPWKSKFNEFLGNPLVKSLRCLTTEDGKVFYVTDDVTVNKGDIGNIIDYEKFDAVTSPDLAHLTSITLKRKNQNLLKSTEPTQSPQALFAKTAMGKLDTLDFPNWECFGVDMVRDLMAGKDINPVLRAIMLQHILQLNQSTATWGGRNEFDKFVNDIADANVEDIGWLDPLHAPDPDLISKLNSLMTKLPSLDDSRAALLQRRDAIVNGVQFTIVGEGIVLKIGDSPEIVSSVNAVASQTAWAIGPDKQLVQLGHFINGHWSVDSTHAQSMPEGSLVFIIAPPN